METENEKQSSGITSIIVILSILLGINYFVVNALVGDSHGKSLYGFWVDFFGGEFWYGLAGIAVLVISAIGISALAIVSAINKK